MMIKPDGVQRNLIAPILDRFLAKVPRGPLGLCLRSRAVPGCFAASPHIPWLPAGRAPSWLFVCLPAHPPQPLLPHPRYIPPGLHPARPQVHERDQAARGDPLRRPLLQALLRRCAAAGGAPQHAQRHTAGGSGVKRPAAEPASRPTLMPALWPPLHAPTRAPSGPPDHAPLRPTSAACRPGGVHLQRPRGGHCAGGQGRGGPGAGEGAGGGAGGAGTRGREGGVQVGGEQVGRGLRLADPS